MLEFEAQALLAALGPVLAGETVTVHLSGALVDGRLIAGEDAVVIAADEAEATVEP